MASKNSVKTYIRNSYYHVYNRGVEKRNIFLDKQDYNIFLSYLKTYLSPIDTFGLQAIITSHSSTSREKEQASKILRLKNYYEKISLLCYALLPNHFHLLLYQRENVINFFMNSLGTRYGMYFNRKYRRKGVLFQDVYKAVLVETDEQLLQLSSYIHLNTLKWLNIPSHNWQLSSLPSSLSEYIRSNQNSWLKTDVILSYFSKHKSQLTYEAFLGLPQDESSITQLILDEE